MIYNVLLSDLKKFSDVDLEKVQESISRITYPLFGELGHSSKPTINLNNVSHEIKNVRIENDKVYGDILFTKNNGKRASEYYEKGIAKFEMRDVIFIQNDKCVTEIISFDLVNKQ